MQQVKIFKSVEPDISSLEQAINAWIRDSKVRVISITGNIAPQSAALDSKSLSHGKSGFAPSDVLVIVLYEDLAVDKALAPK